MKYDNSPHAAKYREIDRLLTKLRAFIDEMDELSESDDSRTQEKAVTGLSDLQPRFGFVRESISDLSHTNEDEDEAKGEFDARLDSLVRRTKRKLNDLSHSDDWDSMSEEDREGNEHNMNKD